MIDTCFICMNKMTLDQPNNIMSFLSCTTCGGEDHVQVVYSSGSLYHIRFCTQTYNIQMFYYGSNALWIFKDGRCIYRTQDSVLPTEIQLSEPEFYKNMCRKINTMVTFL